MSSTRKNVLIVGLHPNIVDYSKYPELTADKIFNAMKKDCADLATLGWRGEVYYIEDEKVAPEQLERKLTTNDFDFVLIGAGVRTDRNYFLLFEQLVNVIHLRARQAQICFNTCPTDSLDAVRRWASSIRLE